MKKEIWKGIKGYEGLYEISSYGRVRGVDRMETLYNGRKRLRKGRILKPSKDTGGYLTCVLCKNSKRKALYIHRLVAQAFIPNNDNLPQVNHKDENKENNCVDNLEFCSHSYNINYGSRNKRIIEKLSKPVLQIDKYTNEIISEYPSTQEAARKLNISQWHISDCCLRKRKSTGGFKWQYANKTPHHLHRQGG